MAINFRKIAEQELTLSPLMMNREQLKTDDLVGKTATVTEFDFATITDENGEDKTYPVLLLEEYPDHYYNGGALMMKLCMAWAGAFGGDCEAASLSLKKEGGVKLAFTASKTKRGRNLTTVSVVD